MMLDIHVEAIRHKIKNLHLFIASLMSIQQSKIFWIHFQSFNLILKAMAQLLLSGMLMVIYM